MKNQDNLQMVEGKQYILKDVQGFIADSSENERLVEKYKLTEPFTVKRNPRGKVRLSNEMGDFIDVSEFKYFEEYHIHAKSHAVEDLVVVSVEEVTAPFIVHKDNLKIFQDYVEGLETFVEVRRGEVWRPIKDYSLDCLRDTLETSGTLRAQTPSILYALSWMNGVDETSHISFHTTKEEIEDKLRRDAPVKYVISEHKVLLPTL